MDIQSVIQSQYLSALAMLKQAIVKCPQPIWDTPQDKDRSWFKAYHALYYAHLYLQATRKDFVRWRGHGKPVSSPPLSKEEVLDYLAFVEQEVIRRVPATDLEAESGFHGIRADKLELQLVNIRHIQQHTGELYERLGTRGNVKLDWAERRHSPRRSAECAA
jgi:hypothetical protein